MSEGGYNPRAHGARCDLCPRRGQSVVPPEGPRGATQAQVAQDPGKDEVLHGRPLIGPTGKRYTKLMVRGFELQGKEWDRAEAWVTNAALCPPKTKGPQEMRLAVICCRPRLIRELRALDREAGLLLMGKWAGFAVYNLEKGAGKYKGFWKAVNLDWLEGMSRAMIRKLEEKKAKKRKIVQPVVQQEEDDGIQEQ